MPSRRETPRRESSFWDEAEAADRVRQRMENRLGLSVGRDELAAARD